MLIKNLFKVFCTNIFLIQSFPTGFHWGGGGENGHGGVQFSLGIGVFPISFFASFFNSAGIRGERRPDPRITILFVKNKAFKKQNFSYSRQSSAHWRAISLQCVHVHWCDVCDLADIFLSFFICHGVHYSIIAEILSKEWSDELQGSEEEGYMYFPANYSKMCITKDFATFNEFLRFLLL